MSRSFTRKQTEQLEAVAGNPVTFLREIYIPTARGPRRFGDKDVIADFQKERFNGILPSIVAVARGEKPPFSYHWWEATKGASKDSDLALCLLWLLFTSRRQLRIQIGARDEDQADEIRLIARQILKIAADLNEFIATKVEIRSGSILNTETGGAAEILTSDTKGLGSHGARPDLVCVNELGHISDQEFVETLIDNADKVPTSVRVLATNAGWLGTWQHTWRETAITSPRWQTHIYSEPAPWVDLADLAESQRRNPTRFARLWRGVWAPFGAGDAFAEDDLKAAMTLAGPLAGPEKGWGYVLGGDLGTAKNYTALVVIGKHVGYAEPIAEEPGPPPGPSRLLRHFEEILCESELPEPLAQRYDIVEGTGALKLAHLAIYRPGATGQRVDLSAVEREIARLHAVFRLQTASIESWQAEQMVGNLRRAGVPVELTHPTPPIQRMIAEAMLSALQERRLALWPDPQLEADLRSLRIVERSAGNVKLEAPTGKSGSHADTCSAAGLALVAARRVVSAQAGMVQGDLVLWS